MPHLQLRGQKRSANLSHLDILICTHNRSAELSKVLDALSVQRPPAGMSWSVLVVDNASTDDTQAIVATCTQKLPVRYIHEPQLGLTMARRRGVLETSAEWIAFVDDDNLVDAGWVAAVSAAIDAHPDAGGIGGRVVLKWEATPPSAVKSFGFCFAEQDLGDQPLEVRSLVGAGMVLKREALRACGWISSPLLADRIGKSLISGGDAEIALRVRGAGYALWYEPQVTMLHLMPASRSTSMYLLRINRSLGATSPLVSLLTWSGDYQNWRQWARGNYRHRMIQALLGLWWSLWNGGQRLAALAWLAYALGYGKGIAEISRLSVERRDALLGLAAEAKRAEPLVTMIAVDAS